MIEKNKIYLVDSGAHYLDGTTDVTRTCFFTDNLNDVPLEQK